MVTSIESRADTFDLDVLKHAGRNQDEAAIGALFAELIVAWGRGDGEAYGAHFTNDADYVAFDGSHTKGRHAISESHQRLFGSWLKGTRLTGEITGLRFLGLDVAIVHATGATLMPGKDRPVRPSIQTLIAVRDGAGWCFAAFHNTRIVHRNAFQWLLFGIATKIFGR